MRRNLDRRLRLHELAEAMGISVSRLAHLFKNQVGLSPAQHLKSIRLQRAKALLEGSTLSVKEVAAQVGLDVSRFVREFRETYGITPLQHRLRVWQPDLSSRKGNPAGLTCTERPRSDGRQLHSKAAGFAYE